MKKFFAILLTLGFLILAVSCGKSQESQKAVYMNINAQQAKEIMDTETGYVILDVRTQEEFDSGHVPGAILIPDYEIKEKAPQVLTDKNQKILIYCRSGRRSKLACEELVNLGYTNLYEFGGIIDWPYETES